VKIYHHCRIPTLDVPVFLTMAEKRWRCPTCGQTWKTLYYASGGSQSVRKHTPFPNIRHFFWKMREKKHVS
jgi:hypothetical protein